jgi:hypothetical protein
MLALLTQTIVPDEEYVLSNIPTHAGQRRRIREACHPWPVEHDNVSGSFLDSQSGSVDRALSFLRLAEKQNSHNRMTLEFVEYLNFSALECGFA